MAYSRRQVTDYVTVMNKDLYDNLQDGIDEVKKVLEGFEETVVTAGSYYGEVVAWYDGNPSSEDRLYRFVTIEGDNREISIANSTDQIVGTSNVISNIGFLGNYHEDDENDPTKVIVSILGVSYVKTSDNTIVANDRVMSDDNGYAVKSSNNLGYRVLRVVETGLLEIVVSPNTDMIQRIRTKIIEVENSIVTLDSKIDEMFLILSDTLSAGSTSLTLSDDSITGEEMIEVFTDIYGVSPESVVCEAGSITIVFKEQETDMNVKVRCL